MTTPTPHGAPELPGLALARLFHETYERLAPQFGYTTRPETREFDPESPNGKLMTAVCAAIQQAAGAVPAGVLAAAKAANKHWNEFGPLFCFDECMDTLDRALAASPSPLGREAGKEVSSDYLVPCAVGGVTQPLTDKQIDDIHLMLWAKSDATLINFARAIEAAHGITSAPPTDAGAMAVILAHAIPGRYAIARGHEDAASQINPGSAPREDELTHDDHPLRHWSRDCPACNSKGEAT